MKEHPPREREDECNCVINEHFRKSEKMSVRFDVLERITLMDTRYGGQSPGLPPQLFDISSIPESALRF
jgi:hypothetical protein